MTAIYVISTILLIASFVIIEKALAKESKAKIEKLEDELLTRDNSIINLNDKLKNSEFSVKIFTKVNKELERKLFRQRGDKGRFIKKENKNEEAA